jgi:pimeloyl-ACP methyl ester carboxylesterase
MSTRLFFRDPMFDAQLVRTVGHACYGGADLGECLAAARKIREKDISGWFTAWMELAERTRAAAEKSLRLSHEVSAREAFLRASNYYRNAYIFLLGSPDADGVRQAYRLQTQTFRQAAGLLDCAAEEVQIPYEQKSLRGYFLRPAAPNPSGAALILNGGYDSTAEECYFWNAAAALRRGYHCLIFDGPGQGHARIEDGLVFRPDWEAVVTPVVNWLERQPAVDRRRIGIVGLSFGGYLALRAASGEPRLAACVADPGQFSMRDLIEARIPPFMARALPDFQGVSGALLRKMIYRRLNKPTAGWALRRGLWAHGVATIEEYLRLMDDYSLAGRAEKIRCPALVCFAEDDEISGSARKAYDSLTGEAELLPFRRSEGAGEHCEAGARLLFHQRALDWLDRRLQLPRASS